MKLADFDKASLVFAALRKGEHAEALADRLDSILVEDALSATRCGLADAMHVAVLDAYQADLEARPALLDKLGMPEAAQHWRDRRVGFGAERAQAETDGRAHTARWNTEGTRTGRSSAKGEKA